MGFPVLAIFDSRRKRRVGSANDAGVLVSANQNFVATGPAHDFVAKKSTDALGAGVPKKDFLIPVNQIHANRKRIQNGPADFRIIKRLHSDLFQVVLSAIGEGGLRAGGKNGLHRRSWLLTF